MTFANGIKFFDHVFFYDDFEIPPVIERRDKFQTWPKLWVHYLPVAVRASNYYINISGNLQVLRIIASLHSPFAETLVVDSDVYACTNFEDLFPRYIGKDSEVGITLAPAPFGASRNYNGSFRM